MLFRSGSAEFVAFARWCEEIILVADAGSGRKLCRVPVSDVVITEHLSVAGEPRDTVAIDTALESTAMYAVEDDIEKKILLLGAVTRAVMMAGAIDMVLEMSVHYAMERAQFGRPIADYGLTSFTLGRMAASLAASRAITYEAAREMDEDERRAAPLAAQEIGRAHV